jgi:hypothetical protein
MTQDSGSTWGGEASGGDTAGGSSWGGDTAGGSSWGGEVSGLPPPPPQGSGSTNGAALAAIICGIGSLLSLFLFFFIVTIPLAILLAIAAIVTGIVGLGAAKRVGTGRGQAVTGIATGSVTLILAALGVLGLALLWSQFDFETNPITDPEGWIEELEERGVDIEDLEEGRVDPEDLLPPDEQ